jgi:hypothetical protein
MLTFGNCVDNRFTHKTLLSNRKTILSIMIVLKYVFSVNVWNANKHMLPN